MTRLLKEKLKALPAVALAKAGESLARRSRFLRSRTAKQDGEGG